MTNGDTGIVIQQMLGGTVQQGSNNLAIDARADNGEGLEQVLQLAAALRTDARYLGGSSKDEIESLADGLESDARKGRWVQVQSAVDRVAGLIESGSKVLEATVRVMSTFS